MLNSHLKFACFFHKNYVNLLVTYTRKTDEIFFLKKKHLVNLHDE
jgi:hypothetical protein